VCPEAAGESALPLGPGDLLGELGLLHRGRWRRTILATSPVAAAAGTRGELERALVDEAVGAHVASVAARRLAERVKPVRAVTPAGLALWLRPLLPADRPQYLAALGALSRETLRRRFFRSARPPDAVIERLIEIDYVDHVAWVAVGEPGAEPDRPLGVCRLITDAEDPKSAEVAIGVVDAHQGRGLGTVLVGALGVVAETRGLAQLEADVLEENQPMRAILDRAGARWTRAEPGVLHARVPVQAVAALLDRETAAQVAAATRELEQAARLADA
jgi:RimJ/RimL family protein N-acetyltransferase